MDPIISTTLVPAFLNKPVENLQVNLSMLFIWEYVILIITAFKRDDSIFFYVGIVGVAIDGIPIYGPWDENGKQLTQHDLDDCGGRYDSNGRYKYHLTTDPPFYLGCIKGEVR